MSITAHEVNFDGIVGPTHNYAGLSYGNVASMKNKAAASNPRAAALQGLAKMKFMADLGLKQAVLPPHERPHLPTLRRLGYTGSDADVLAKVAKEDPVLLASVSSSSAMWTANAATVSPSADTADGRVHFTPANLLSNFHRAIEAETTARVLRAIFADQRHFAHHPPLPAATAFSDEGAANHTRLVEWSYNTPGFELFAYGRQATEPTSTKFPARQTREACAAIARLHGLKPFRTFYLRQSAAAIDAGAFHNDVVAVGDRQTLLYHERAWEDADAAVEQIARVFQKLVPIKVAEADVPLADAISTYLFNSQLVTLWDGSQALVAPIECRENERVRALIESLPLRRVEYVDVRQSMRNGGGPACLRLRIVLTHDELVAARRGVMFDEALHAQLVAWVERNYREALAPTDLADPTLLDESRRALDELTQILDLGSLYEFQK